METRKHPREELFSWYKEAQPRNEGEMKKRTIYEGCWKSCVGSFFRQREKARNKGTGE